MIFIPSQVFARTVDVRKAEALGQAMLATMKTNPNPRDWAAFILVGEAD